MNAPNSIFTAKAGYEFCFALYSILPPEYINQGMQDQRTIDTSRPPARETDDQSNHERGQKLHEQENSPIHIWLAGRHFEQIDIHVTKVPESKEQGNDKPVDKAGCPESNGLFQPTPAPASKQKLFEDRDDGRRSDVSREEIGLQEIGAEHKPQRQNAYSYVSGQLPAGSGLPVERQLFSGRTKPEHQADADQTKGNDIHICP